VSLPDLTVNGKSGRAEKAGKTILEITATRTVSGVHVDLTGGEELRKLFEVLSARDGMPRPKVNLFGIPDLNVWMGGYEIDNIYPCQPPGTPQFGVWIIRHAHLGMSEKTSFVLPVPHSQAHIKDTVRAVVDASNAIFRAYATKVVVSGEARTEEPLAIDPTTVRPASRTRPNIQVPDFPSYDSWSEERRDEGLSSSETAYQNAYATYHRQWTERIRARQVEDERRQAAGLPPRW
jgi:hypothetical protein